MSRRATAGLGLVLGILAGGFGGGAIGAQMPVGSTIVAGQSDSSLTRFVAYLRARGITARYVDPRSRIARVTLPGSAEEVTFAFASHGDSTLVTAQGAQGGMAALIVGMSAISDWQKSRRPAIDQGARLSPSGNAIFREIVIVGDTIRLGQPLGAAAHYAASASDTVVALPYGSFEGADAITIFRRANGRVARVQFLYGAQRSFSPILGDYESTLGPPADSTVPADPTNGQWTWTWRDPHTEFRLIRFVPAAGQIAAQSVVIDRNAGSSSANPQ